MKILILGRTAGYETAQLVAAARERGHEASVVWRHALRLRAGNGPAIDVAGRGVDAFDLLYVRKFWPYVSEVLLVAQAFAAAGKPVVDAAILQAPFIMSKIGDLQALAAAGLPVPRTAQCFTAEEVEARLSEFSFPVIVKGVYGSAGRRVFLAGDAARVRTIFSRAPHPGFFALQEYLPSHGDLRVVTVDGATLGAIERRIPPGDFRANLSRGGIPRKAELPEELRDLAERASRVLGREFAGVDILVSGGKPYILEVNRAPGFAGFASATNIDVAAAFIRHCEKRLYGGAD